VGSDAEAWWSITVRMAVKLGLLTRRDVLPRSRGHTMSQSISVGNEAMKTPVKPALKPVVKPAALRDDRFKDLPFPVEDPRMVEAKAHVWGCKPVLVREMMKREEDQEAQWERIAALEKMVSTLTTLVMAKKK
jgi:hypothetical protein